MNQQKPFSEMSQQELYFHERYKRLYPPDRPSWIGDILGELEDIKARLAKIESGSKPESKEGK